MSRRIIFLAVNFTIFVFKTPYPDLWFALKLMQIYNTIGYHSWLPLVVGSYKRMALERYRRYLGVFFLFMCSFVTTLRCWFCLILKMLTLNTRRNIAITLCNRNLVYNLSENTYLCFTVGGGGYFCIESAFSVTGRQLQIVERVFLLALVMDKCFSFSGVSRLCQGGRHKSYRKPRP